MQILQSHMASSQTWLCLLVFVQPWKKNIQHLLPQSLHPENGGTVPIFMVLMSILVITLADFRCSAKVWTVGRLCSALWSSLKQQSGMKSKALTLAFWWVSPIQSTDPTGLYQLPPVFQIPCYVQECRNHWGELKSPWILGQLVYPRLRATCWRMQTRKPHPVPAGLLTFQKRSEKFIYCT